MNKIAVIVFLLLTLSACNNPTKNSTITINGERLIVETVSSQADQARGLSGRSSLDQDRGMLFIFNDYKDRTFWMKGMEIPLDIVWIKDDIIVGAATSVPVPTSSVLLRYHSPEPVDAVLEVNAGWLEAHNIKVGSKLEGLTN